MEVDEAQGQHRNVMAVDDSEESRSESDEFDQGVTESFLDPEELVEEVDENEFKLLSLEQGETIRKWTKEVLEDACLPPESARRYGDALLCD